MKYTTKTIHEVDYNDLDDAINQFLKSKGAKKCDFEIVAHHELGNYSSTTFGVGLYSFDKVEDDVKQDILDGDLRWKADEILNWMHEDGLIPAGDYLVKISW